MKICMSWSRKINRNQWMELFQKSRSYSGRRTEFSPTYRVTGTLQIMQNLCEEGHKSYVCTCQSSYLNSSCCGRNHVSYTFPFMVPTLSNSGGKNSSGSSPSYWSYSQSSIGSTPSTVVSKTHKENDEKNVIHP